MNKSIIFVGLIAIALLLMGCAATVSSPLPGFLYTDVQAPLAVTSNSGSSKVGTAEAVSILGFFASGNAGIDAAAKQGGITKIQYVDYHAKNILGIYAKYTVYVYGE